MVTAIRLEPLEQKALLDRLQALEQRRLRACHEAGRDPCTVQLLAVSKGQSSEAIRVLYQAGIRCFGENYVQEVQRKKEQLADLDIEWHLIGHLQTNKASWVASHCAWVQSLDSLKLAERLNQFRLQSMSVSALSSGLSASLKEAPLNVCIQIKTTPDSIKKGISCDQLLVLAESVHRLPCLRLRGVMSLPDDVTAAPMAFAAAQAQFRVLQKMCADWPQPPTIDCLSMGMSGDLEQAILAGSTLIRVGSALFGPRNPGL